MMIAYRRVVFIKKEFQMNILLRSTIIILVNLLCHTVYAVEDNAVYEQIDTAKDRWPAYSTKKYTYEVATELVENDAPMEAVGVSVQHHYLDNGLTRTKKSFQMIDGQLYLVTETWKTAKPLFKPEVVIGSAVAALITLKFAWPSLQELFATTPSDKQKSQKNSTKVDPDVIMAHPQDLMTQDQILSYDADYQTKYPITKIVTTNTEKVHTDYKLSDKITVTIHQGNFLNPEIFSSDTGNSAVVNAANTGLRAGGGVCEAIFKAANPEVLPEDIGQTPLQKECYERLQGKTSLPIGQAVITSSYGIQDNNSKVTNIIHAVGPNFSREVNDRNQNNDADQRRPALLISAYRKSLDVADQNGIENIAFPLISSGIFRAPKTLSAQCALQAFREYAQDKGNKANVKHIHLVLYNPGFVDDGNRQLDYNLVQPVFDQGFSA